MLSISPASEHYLPGLVNERYYSEGGEAPGRWLGSGAQALGLRGQVGETEFVNLFRGFSPDGTRPLVQNAVKRITTRTKEDGTVQEYERQDAWDLTFSSPKSFSVLWALSPDTTRELLGLVELEAVKRAIAYIESVAAYTRRGKGGTRRERAKLVIAAYPHHTSRSNDPQRHWHCVCMNVGLRDDGSTGSIESHHFYRYQLAAGAAYRAHLSMLLEKTLGLSAIAHGRCFEIAGVPDEVRELFSTRRREIMAHLAELGVNSSALAPQIAEIINLETRPDKDHPPLKELLQLWRDQASALGFSSRAVADLLHRSAPPVREIDAEKRQAVGEALRTFTYYESHFTQRQLEQFVFEQAQLRGIGVDVSLEAVDQWLHHALEIAEALQMVRLTPEEATREQRYSTTETIAQETELLTTFERLSARPGLQIPESTIAPVLESWQGSAQTLNQEQAEAVQYLLTAPGQVKALSGLPGTGKTRALSAVRECLEQEGFSVLGASVAGRAADELQHKSGVASDTLHKTLCEVEKGRVVIPSSLIGAITSHRETERQRKFYETLIERQRYQLDDKTVVVLDEAGTVGTRLMLKLLQEVERSGASLLCVGDSQQLPPVEAGGPFKIATQMIPHIALQKMQRQHEPWQVRAAQEVAAGNSREALHLYQEHGCLHLAETPKAAMKELIARWSSLSVSRPEDHVIIAMTNFEVDELNRRAQWERFCEGCLGEAQLQLNDQSFLEGDRVIFRSDRQGRANFRIYGVRNGQFGVVEAIDEARRTMTIRVDAGKHVTIAVDEFTHLRLGYAVTTYLVQGSDRLEISVLIGGGMESRERFFVEITRHTENLMIYADRMTAGEDLTRLISQIERSRSKELAVTLLPDKVQEFRKEERLAQQMTLER